MSISTYTELQAAVASWMNRTDLTAQIPDFITMAEAHLNTDLKTRSMETKVALSTADGVAVVALPSDMLEMRRLQILAERNQPLSYRTPDELSFDFADNRTGQPQVFTVVGSNIELAPVPDGVYTIELTYQQRIASLSASNQTNWLLSAWPGAYLFGALIAAQPFIMNDERMPTFQAMYREIVDGINSVDWYSGSTMKVRAR